MLTQKNVTALLLLTVTLTVISISCEKNNNGNIVSDGLMLNGGGPPSMNGKTEIIEENPFLKTIDSATSTFSIDADGGSYAVTRRSLIENLKNDFKGLRTEEMLNYFTYNYENPTGDAPIGVNGEVSICPWNAEHKLIRIGIKGKSIAREEYPFANFVLLVDVSGSMSGSDKLELLKNGLIDFANQMRDQDRVAIVTYAGNESLALGSTPGTQKDKIIAAIKKLGSGGSTNGAAGIKLAYDIAQKNFITNGNNRVILGTDGDFNVGVTSTEELVKLIEEEREKGIFLTTLGVGTYNNEAMMEKVANKGNGNYEYLDTKEEMKKVFVDEYNKFLTVAKDVKVQVTFNSNLVEEYRLIGYENRVLKSDDFNDDKADAGEIGAGQTITAIYEIKPKNSGINFKSVPTFAIHFRYKKPTETTSNPLDLDIYDAGHDFAASSENMRFAASVAAFGLYLRNSAYKGTVTLNEIKSWSAGAVSFDPNGYRVKHLSLLEKAK